MVEIMYVFRKVLALIIAGGIVVSCKAENHLLGTWQKFDSRNDAVQSLEFFSDNTCIYNNPATIRGSVSARISCDWIVLENKKIKVSLNNKGLEEDHFSPVGFVELRDDDLYVDHIGDFKNATLYTEEQYLIERQYASAMSLSSPHDYETMHSLAEAGLTKAMNSLAWEYASVPQADKSMEALELAKNSVSAQKKKFKQGRGWADYYRLAFYTDTLAATYARNHDFSNAVNTQKGAIDLITEIQENRAESESYVGNRPNITDYTVWSYKDRLASYEKGEPNNFISLNDKEWKVAGELGGSFNVKGKTYTTETQVWFHTKDGKRIHNAAGGGEVYYFGSNKYLFLPKNKREAAFLGEFHSRPEMNGGCATLILQTPDSLVFEDGDDINCKFEYNDIKFTDPSDGVDDEKSKEKRKQLLLKEAKDGNGKALEDLPYFFDIQDEEWDQLWDAFEKFLEDNNIPGSEKIFAESAALSGHHVEAKKLFSKREQNRRFIVEGLTAWNETKLNQSVVFLIEDLEKNIKEERRLFEELLLESAP